MRKIEVSIDMIKKNIKENVKIIIAIFLIFFVVGVGFGWVSMSTYKYNISNTEEEAEVELSKIEKDGGYYYYAVNNLKMKRDYINAYLLYFTQVDLSVESREKLEKIRETMGEYDEKEFQNLVWDYKQKPTTCNGKYEETKEFYEEKLRKKNEDLEKLQIEIETLEETEVSQNSKAQELEELKKQKKFLEEDTFLEKYISDLEVQSEAAIVNNRSYIDNLLSINEKKINTIVKSFNKTMAEISKEESYEIVYNKYLLDSYYNEIGIAGELKNEDILKNKKNQAIIYAKSIEKVDVKTERFMASLTFFILLGVVISFTVGSLYSRNIKR